MAVTNQGTIAAVVESGRILDVDINTYTVSVTTQYTKKPQTGITWSSPYTHFVNGEGMYIMPEVGSMCWICFPSDGNRPFVMGWAPAGDEGDYRARRRDLNPGDIFMGTRDENFIILRRGGILQLGGGPLCQRIYFPVGNTIKDFCENYSLKTLGGELNWLVERQESTTDGTRPASLSIKAWEFTDDPSSVAELIVGSHGSGNDTIVSLLVKESGKQGAATKVELTLDKKGNVVWTVKKDVTWTVEGKYTIEAKKDVTIKSTSAKVVIEGSTSVDVTGGDVTITASSGTVTITGAPTVKMGSKVEVGSSPEPVALAKPLLKWLASHTHLVTSAPGTTGPASAAPSGPPGSDIMSQTLSASP